MSVAFPASLQDGRSTRLQRLHDKVTPAWLKLIPSGLRARIEHRPHLLKAMSNTGWLFGDQMLRMAVGLLVGVWIARYLGPEQFGLLNYAMAFVALFGGIASLGLNGIVVRNLVKDPEAANVTLGSAFILQIIGGLLAFFLAITAISFARPDDTLAKLMVAVLGFVMVFKSTEVVKCWFESQVQSKYTVLMENGTYLIFAAVKVALILGQASLMAFVWAAFAEGLLVAAGLLWIYALLGGHLKAWRVSYAHALTQLGSAWPIIMSGTFVLVNLSIDKVLLRHLANPQELGLYSAASVLVAAWFFVPVAIGGSIAPRLTKLHAEDEPAYSRLKMDAYKYFGLGSAVIALAIYFWADNIVGLLYGQAYSAASDVLTLNIWAIVFISIVSLRGRLLIIENKQVNTAWLVFMGMASNILLNLWLIPGYGAVGAACSFSISWGLNALFFPLLFRATRRHGLMAAGLATRL